VKSNQPNLKIAIIGGGLVGRLLGWRLAKQQSMIDNGITYNINIFEKGSLLPPPSQKDKAAAFTAAAMISPMSELVASELEVYQLGQASLKLWPQWLKQLDSSQHFHQQGSLVLAHPNDIGELTQFQRDLNHKLRDQLNALTESEDLTVLTDRSQLEALEPSISAHFNNGLYLPSEAHIDHNEVLQALVSESQKLGIGFIENCAIEPDDEALKGFDILFDCRGMGLKSDVKNNLEKQDFRGVRGEVIRLECKEVTLQRPIRLMHPRYKLYIVPKPNHQFIIGATEIESEDRSSISLRSSMELMSALYAVNPAFAEARIISQDTNLRPAYMDNLPRIESHSTRFDKPIIRINGLYRHGYLIGPALVEQAIQRAQESCL